MNFILAPSILSADFLDLRSEIKAVEEAGAQYLHFDVMDGMFVPNISFGIPVLKCIKGNTNLKLDVHLMIEDPSRYFEKFKEAGAEILTVHVEAMKDARADLLKIKELGMIPSITLSPDTDVKEVFPYMDLVKQVLVMTVEPGAGAQPYIDKCTDKIKAIREEAVRRGLDIDVEVDGGINEKTIITAAKAGANVFVMGSSIFNGKPFESVKKYEEILKAEK
ncbi:MAG: ribulose-phosphate 3-epimerase [Lachnospiraceae bacterium]|nr:ribulose-phosphate 3-epimerase [Lachnospiraceae bacterium]